MLDKPDIHDSFLLYLTNMLGDMEANISLKLSSKEFIEVFPKDRNPKVISAEGNFQKHHATATLLPLRLICARGLPDQGRTPKDEGKEA